MHSLALRACKVLFYEGEQNLEHSEQTPNAN